MLCYFMPFIAYYNIVNGYFKLYVNICEKLGKCRCAQRLWDRENFKKK